MKAYHVFALCAFALYGCNGQEPTSNELPMVAMGVKPGTRLQPKLLLADDGTLFLHPTIWKDAEYGECIFRTVVDGSYRCLPNVPSQVDAHYLDPSCIQEVFVYRPIETCIPMGAYSLVYTPVPGCADDVYRVLRTDKKIDATSVFIKVADLCQPTSMPNDAEVYLLTDEIPTSEFVSAWR